MAPCRWPARSRRLLHDSAETLESYLAKQDRYTTLVAEAALAAGKRASIVRHRCCASSSSTCCSQGFLDGWPGLVHILIGCRNSHVKYAKMRAERKLGLASHEE